MTQWEVMPVDCNHAMHWLTVSVACGHIRIVTDPSDLQARIPESLYHTLAELRMQGAQLEMRLRHMNLLALMMVGLYALMLLVKMGVLK